MPARAKLTLKQWAKLRALWESGRGTFKELGKQFKIAEQTIKHKSCKDGWIENGQKKAIEAKVAENMTAMIARLGMPKENLVKLMIKGAEGTKTLKNIKEFAKDKDGNIIHLMNGHPLVIERTVPVIDNAITLQYREELLKLSNYYPAPKASVEEVDAPEEPIPLVIDLPKAEPQKPLTPTPDATKSN